MRRARVWTLLGIACASVQAHAQTVDDLARLESFGDVQVSPDGRWVAYERNASAAQREPVYYPHFFNAGRVRVTPADRSDPWIVAIEDAVAINLFAGGPSWRNDSGAFVVRVAKRSGESSAALVDPRSRRVTPLPGSVPFAYAHFVWLSDGRLIYATSNGRYGRGISVQQYARTLEARWQGTLEGYEPQVTVSSASPLVEPKAAGTIAPGSLNLFDSRSGSTVKLADGDFMWLTLSPDGKRLAALCLPEDMRTRAAFGINWEILSAELCVYRFEHSTLTLEARSQGLLIYPRNITWSPDGRELLVAGRGEKDDLYDPKIYRYRSEDGTLSVLVPPPGTTIRDFGLRSFAMGALQHGWIGSTPVVVAARRDESAANHRQGAGSLTYGEYDGYRFDVWALGSEPVNLTAFSRTSVMAFESGADGRSIHVTANGSRWRIEPDGTRREQPAAKEPASQPEVPPGFSALAQRNGMRIGMVSDAHDVRSLVSVRGKDVTVLDTVNAFLRELPPSNRRQIEYEVGSEVRKAWVVLPRNYDPSRRYPGILHVYGGTVFGGAPSLYVRMDTPSPFYNANVLADRGFVIVVPELPLAPGYRSDLGRSMADAAVAAADAAAALGLIDGERVGLMGSSFGAYSTLAILAHASDRFRAAVAENPVGSVNPLAWWGEQARIAGLGHAIPGGPVEEFVMAGFAEGGQLGLGGPPWKVPEHYLRNSPFFRAPYIKAPVMLIASDLDSSSLAASQAMYAALVREGNEAVLVHYWGESHAISSPANQRDELERITAWFTGHLKAPAP